jgi:hypothetical protein
MADPTTDRTAKKRSRRKVIDAYAACGSHGKPWAHYSGPSSYIGQLAVFETHRAAKKAHGGNIHRVKLYIEQEPCND